MNSLLLDSWSFAIIILSLLLWIYLLLFRGQFWRCDQRLGTVSWVPQRWPSVCAIIPARNEADVLPVSLRSLFQQEYPGAFVLRLIDDQSSDGTGLVAQAIATEYSQPDQFQRLTGQPLPGGWSGKLWAMEQGIRHANQTLKPDYFLLTDADIEHEPNNLRQLVTKAEQDQLDLVSLMVQLRCDSGWEQWLIPAFVFFFQKLYPFRWVNHPDRAIAGAAGGCLLIRADALTRIGGLEVVRDALIDDCALAVAVKSSRPQAKIWLGLAEGTRSLRPYNSLTTIWGMVARTAYTQLHYSPLLLMGTVLGMAVIYLAAPLGLGWGFFSLNVPLLLLSGLTWGLMAIAYWPTLNLYRCPPWRAFTLPAIAFLYSLMTLDSARRHWLGKGGAWKGRVYPEAQTPQ